MSDRPPIDIRKNRPDAGRSLATAIVGAIIVTPIIGGWVLLFGWLLSLVTR